ncbi:MAG: class E sortase [Microbacteriaceae bacterium]
MNATAPAKPIRLSVLGVVGELLITAGVLVLFFLAWQLWWNEIVSSDEQTRSAGELSKNWDQALPVPPPAPHETTEPEVVPPPLIATPPPAAAFASMLIPRFGNDFARPVHSGIGFTVLAEGIGYYPDGQLPGQSGNFAVAGHRTTYGKPFAQIADLRVGDAVVIETAEGWFTYRFRNLEYVWPTGVGVLAPVPQQLKVTATDSVLTMTSCNPRFSAAERIIAYSLFESFTPRSAGAPTVLSATAVQ